jgi:hypothetical protein
LHRSYFTPILPLIAPRTNRYIACHPSLTPGPWPLA